ncbi:Outer membrane protein (porin) [Rhodoferax sp. OV413]|uniref:porin n=1 Tax=Rhodoferax sp. OV413 TaxID=1855285 RepID=UPI00088BD32D|nr:porin [Rhodoferax sp. OV413]SDO37157.1 Outer membrane protein (porin) [Rhodoferax sp. OV413]
MKKLPIILSMAACTSAAFAQSTVSISGTVDLAVRSVDNGAVKQTQMVRDGINSSRLRFIGTEDLGGGLKAGFWLDMPVRADDGTGASVFWERRSTVSLLGSFGELRLGRDAALQNSGPGDFDAFNGKGVGNVMNLATPRNFSNATTFTRVNNAVSYLLPNVLGGFYGQVQLAPGEGVIGAKHSAFALGYKDGPLETRFTYGRTHVDSVAVVNTITGASTATAASGSFTYAVLGSSYDFGRAKLMGSLINWNSAEAVAGSRKQFTYNIGAMVPIGSGSLNVAYTHANRSGLGSDAQDAKQFAVQYIHSLSKRTAVYASAARIKQDALATTSNAQYNMDGTNLVGRSGTGFDFGIRHSF